MLDDTVGSRLLEVVKSLTNPYSGERLHVVRQRPNDISTARWTGIRHQRWDKAVADRLVQRRCLPRTMVFVENIWMVVVERESPSSGTFYGRYLIQVSPELSTRLEGVTDMCCQVSVCAFGSTYVCIFNAEAPWPSGHTYIRPVSLRLWLVLGS